jgi:hypothetical protein
MLQVMMMNGTTPTTAFAAAAGPSGAPVDSQMKISPTASTPPAQPVKPVQQQQPALFGHDTAAAAAHYHNLWTAHHPTAVADTGENAVAGPASLLTAASSAGYFCYDARQQQQQHQQQLQQQQAGEKKSLGWAADPMDVYAAGLPQWPYATAYGHHAVYGDARGFYPSAAYHDTLSAQAQQAAALSAAAHNFSAAVHHQQQQQQQQQQASAQPQMSSALSQGQSSSNGNGGGMIGVF